MVDQIFSIGVLAFILAIVILMKDIIDGGTFAPSERRSALLGFGLAGLLVLSALTMSMISSDTVIYQSDNDDDFTAYYYQSGGLSSTPTVYQSNNQLAVSPHTSASATVLEIRFNLTTWSSDDIQNLRSIEMNLTGIQILGVMIATDSGVAYSASNHPDTVSFTNTAPNSYFKFNFSETQSLLLQSQVVNTFEILVDLTNTDTSKSKTIDFVIEVENQSELANFLIWAVMSFALYIPLMIYLDAFNNIRRFVNDPLGRMSGNSRRRRYTKMRR